MSDHSSDRKARKDSQLVIRIKKIERDTFVELCDRLDTSAAREIRQFIRDFTLAHAAPATTGEPDSQADKTPEKKHRRKNRPSKKK